MINEEEGGQDTPAHQLKKLSKKYKSFYPDEILFEGERIAWVL